MVANIFMYKVVEEKIWHKWRDYILHYVKYGWVWVILPMGVLWKDTPPCRSVEVGEVHGKNEKNPRVKETCGLFQWLDECP